MYRAPISFYNCVACSCFDPPFTLSAKFIEQYSLAISQLPLIHLHLPVYINLYAMLSKKKTICRVKKQPLLCFMNYELYLIWLRFSQYLIWLFIGKHESDLSPLISQWNITGTYKGWYSSLAKVYI